MGTESIEYYAACPQCGAANVGKGKCDYCGASLIKSRTTTSSDFNYSRQEEEEKNLQEDMNYPEIEGKIYEIDEFLLIFCPIFGGMFILVPTIICIAFSSAGIMEIWVLAMLAMFWMIGIGAFVPLINSFVKRSKCKNGREISGVVRGYERTMVEVNGRPVLKIRILIDERTDPKILLLNTGGTSRKYALGKVIKLKGYDNNFIIVKEKLT